MQDKILATPTPGGVRTPLAKALPLKTPYLLQIFPVYACNFRCGYCIYAMDKSQHGYISDETFMDFNLYKKCVDEMASFENPLKMLRFAAIGEPLLHKQIAEMVEYAKVKKIANSIDIVTNASLLTNELSDKLIQAGLSKLRISLEGLSAEDYLKNCRATIDFDKMVEQIRYFYENCNHTKVYIKIIDYMVPTKEQQDRFFALFSPICHEIAIEHLTPTIDSIDYLALANGSNIDKPQNEDEMIDTKICPQPFYIMQINPDGKVVPCCAMTYPAVLGDVHAETVSEIWNGKKYNELRLDLLNGVEQANPVCASCKLYLYDMHRDDLLDNEVERLREVYKI